MAKKPALGRGLAALLREEQADGYLDDLGASAKASSEGEAPARPAAR